LNSTNLDVKKIVKEHYGQAAAQAKSGSRSRCGPSGSCCSEDPITKDLYTAEEIALLPEKAVLASLGCGNPTALAELSPGEIVLDLGSGGGIDVLLSAKRVGPEGKAYGLDMTDEMLSLARENQRKAGVDNAEFLKGEIESIPLPDNSLDVIISNCVINLSADKDSVLREGFRVLKPGGRFAVSDVVMLGNVPQEILKSVELWAGCVAGALHAEEYRKKLVNAGFEEVNIEPTRIFQSQDVRDFVTNAGLDADAVSSQVDGKFASAFIRARKPGASKPSVQVFDPAMCCSTGVCGPAVDPKLAQFAADLDWLSKQGAAVERYNLAQQPEAFAANEQVKRALQYDETDCLPLILVNGVIVSKGSYPARTQMARWIGVNEELPKSIYTEAVGELVAIGAAIASNCEPCFRYHYDRARKLGVSKEDMLLAVNTAKAVKDTPARAVVELAERYLMPKANRQQDTPTTVSCCGTESKPGCCS
jgi:arsenite methyltransferase